MSFKQIYLKNCYDSDEDNILTDFYIPILSNAIHYKRIAGYFSSSSFALAASGLAKFIENGGIMQLIVNIGLPEQDVEAIKRGLKSPKEIIDEMMINNLDSLESELIRNHVQALAWMVAKRKLDIKIAIVDENIGIFHQKTGILEDQEGNKVSFSGSDNESASGWAFNIEEFKVFKNWENSEKHFLESDIKRFEKFWNNMGSRTIVVDFPDALRKKLISMAPKDSNDLDAVLKYISRSHQKKKKTLRDYQESAINSWINNDHKGIFEMATASGKTFTAISCIGRVETEVNGLLVIVACPFQHLVTQWKKELEDCGYEAYEIYGNKNKWSGHIANKILDLKLGYCKKSCFITTYDTLASEYFIEMMDKVTVPIFFIGDEIHCSGSSKRSQGLLNKFVYRLGLSATPSRWFDDEGTKIILDYFDKTVFEFTINDAIKRGFLTPYEYNPHFVSLEERELKEYRDLGRKMAMLSSKKDSINKKKFELLGIRRQSIVKNAHNKLSEFDNILDDIKEIDKCLVYCSPQQIERVMEIMTMKGILFHRFTAEEDVEERENILKNFENGIYKSLVAMKCLDEGVDVPATKTAIILASSGNPREFIQRRGRVLRIFPGKVKSIIHDIIVVPKIDAISDTNYIELEKRILIKELSRLKEFADSSINPLRATRVIMDLMYKYNIIGDTYAK